MKINLRFRRIADYLKLHRKEAALAFAFGCIGLLSWALVRSYKEPADLAAAYPPLFEEFVHFRLTVLGIDEVHGIAEVKAEVISDWRATDNYIRLLRLRGMPPFVVTRMSAPDTNGTLITAFTLPPAFLGQRKVASLPPPTDDFIGKIVNPSSKAALYFGPVTLRDAARSFDASGVAAFANLTPSAIDVTPGPTYKAEPPPPLSADLEIVGDSWRYPFDRYLLIGEILCNVFISTDTDSRDFRSFDVQQTDVDVRSPGFVQKYLSIDDLRRLRRGAPQAGLHVIMKHPTAGQVGDNKDAVFNYLDRATQAREKSSAIEIRRPFFLRFFSVFLLVVTVASMAYYIVKSTVREFGLQAMAYFAGLWAVRQILMSNGPKTFTLVDYTVLTLYFGLIVALLAKAIYTPKAIPH